MWPLSFSSFQREDLLVISVITLRAHIHLCPSPCTPSSLPSRLETPAMLRPTQRLARLQSLGQNETLIQVFLCRHPLEVADSWV